MPVWPITYFPALYVILCLMKKKHFKIIDLIFIPQYTHTLRKKNSVQILNTKSWIWVTKSTKFKIGCKTGQCADNWKNCCMALTC